MSVSLVVTGNTTEIPPHIASAIKSIRTSGPGAFYDIRVNGVTFRKVLISVKSASLVTDEGIWIDGKLVKRLKNGDKWYIGRVDAQQTVYGYDHGEALLAWGTMGTMALY